MEIDFYDDEMIEMLESAVANGVVEIEDCGCVVELDGICPHGNKSPFLEACLI